MSRVMGQNSLTPQANNDLNFRLARDQEAQCTKIEFGSLHMHVAHAQYQLTLRLELRVLLVRPQKKKMNRTTL